MALSNDEFQRLVLALGVPIYSAPISFRPTRALVPVTPVTPVSTIVKVKEVINTTTNAGSNPSGKAGVPLILTSLAAVQTPVKQQSFVNSAVQVNFTQDPADKNFDHVNIWFVGYHGSSNPQLMSSGNTSPISFICDATRETVSVFAQTVSSTGLSAPVQFAAHTVVTLSGTVGKPPAPTISQSLIGTAIGFQFSFNQVVLPANDIEVISAYNIYRATVNTFASAALHSVVSPNPKLIGALTYSDVVHDSTGVFYYYWVTAVNTAKFESLPTPAQSGNVLGSSGSTPVSISTPFKSTTTTSSVTWSTSPSCFFTRADGTTTTIGQTSTGCTGLPTGNNVYFFPYWRESDQTLQYVNASDAVIPNITGVSMTAGSSQYIQTATTGSIPATFSIEMWVKASAAGALFDYSAPQVGGVATASICQAQITAGGEVQFSIWNGAAWTSVTTSGATVLDSTWHHIVCTYGTTTGTIYVDGVNTSNGTTIWTNAVMGTISATAGWWHFGFCGGFAGAPLTVNTFNTSVMSHISLYTHVITAIETAAHTQAFSNIGEAIYLQELTFDTAANLWKLTESGGSTAADSIGSNTGTYVGSPSLNQTSAVITVLGTPAIAWPFNSLFALQQQNLRNRAPLSNSGMKASTATASTGSSGGSGGGYTGSGGRGGTCFTAETKLLDGRSIGSIKEGDQVWVEQADGSRILRHVSQVLIHDYDGVLFEMEDGGCVTPDHQFRVNGSWVKASSIFNSLILFAGKVHNLHIDSTDPEEHNYILANGRVAHNYLKLSTL